LTRQGSGGRIELLFIRRLSLAADGREQAAASTKAAAVWQAIGRASSLAQALEQFGGEVRDDKASLRGRDLSGNPPLSGPTGQAPFSGQLRDLRNRTFPSAELGGEQ